MRKMCIKIGAGSIGVMFSCAEKRLYKLEFGSIVEFDNLRVIGLDEEACRKYQESLERVKKKDAMRAEQKYRKRKEVEDAKILERSNSN